MVGRGVRGERGLRIRRRLHADAAGSGSGPRDAVHRRPVGNAGNRAVSASAGRRNWVAIALVASVALNLFLCGVFAGRIGSQLTQGVRAQRNVEAALAPLPEAKRNVVIRELRRVMPEVRRDQQAVQQARAAAAEELLRPQPDSAALDRHFREVQVRTTSMQNTLQQALKRAAADLTPEERRALIEAANRRAPRLWLPEP
ncbi:MAG: periplasmic heavy metal sensor [Betaproteobacteria bacterium]|nr:periplasmic heavy metal sensor [Betaproteobacteria bacterium]